MEKSVSIIKPNGKTILVDGHPFTKYFEQCIEDIGLSIEDKFDILLDEEGIRTIFPILNVPSEFGEIWKNEFITFMLNESLPTYILKGNGAINKLHNLKKSLRNTLLGDNQDYRIRVIKNILHTCDKEDLHQTLNAIMKYRQ